MAEQQDLRNDNSEQSTSRKESVWYSLQKLILGEIHLGLFSVNTTYNPIMAFSEFLACSPPSVAIK